MWDNILQEAKTILSENMIAIGVLVLCGVGWLWGVLTKKGRVRKAAQKIHDAAMGGLGSDLKIESVDLGDFGWLDHDWYEATTREVSALGFHAAGDYELTNLSENDPSTRTCVRALVAGHGHIVAGVWQVKVRGWKRWLLKVFRQKGEFRTIDLETELGDGSFVVTTNVDQEDKLSQPDQVHWERHPQELTAMQLHGAHIAHVQRVMAGRPGVAPVAVTSVEGLIGFQKRLHGLQQQHRQAIGGVSEEEMGKFLDESHGELGEEVAAEVERLRQENGVPQQEPPALVS